MLSRSIILAAGLAGGMLAASAASAAPGWATGDVNMRSCGSTSCGKITVIPEGAEVEVYGCDGWCELDFAGYHGYASRRYIALGDGGYAPVPPPVVVRPPIPPRVYWQYGRPHWDPRYGAWYDGRRWWYDGGWHGRRPRRGGLSLEFNF